MKSSFDVAPRKIPLWSGAVGIIHVHEYNYGCGHHKIGYIAVAPETMSSLCLPTYQLEVINGPLPTYNWGISHFYLGYKRSKQWVQPPVVFYMVPNDLWTGQVVSQWMDSAHPSNRLSGRSYPKAPNISWEDTLPPQYSRGRHSRIHLSQWSIPNHSPYQAELIGRTVFSLFATSVLLFLSWVPLLPLSLSHVSDMCAAIAGILSGTR